MTGVGMQATSLRGAEPAATLGTPSDSRVPPNGRSHFPSSLSLGLTHPSSSSRPMADHYHAAAPEPISSISPAAVECSAVPIARVRLSDIIPYEGAPCEAYVKAVEALSGSLTKHNAVVIELGTEDSTMMRCALDSARMYFKARTQCSGVGSGIDTWRKSSRGVYMYRAGR